MLPLERESSSKILSLSLYWYWCAAPVSESNTDVVKVSSKYSNKSLTKDNNNVPLLLETKSLILSVYNLFWKKIINNH